MNTQLWVPAAFLFVTVSAVVLVIRIAEKKERRAMQWNAERRCGNYGRAIADFDNAAEVSMSGRSGSPSNPIRICAACLRSRRLTTVAVLLIVAALFALLVFSISA